MILPELPYGQREQTSVDEFIRNLGDSHLTYDEARMNVLRLNSEETLCLAKNNWKRRLLGYRGLIKKAKTTQ